MIRRNFLASIAAACAGAIAALLPRKAESQVRGLPVKPASWSRDAVPEKDDWWKITDTWSWTGRDTYTHTFHAKSHLCHPYTWSLTRDGWKAKDK